MSEEPAIDDLAFDPLLKKKKKTKKAVSFDQFSEDAANLEEAGDVDDVLALSSAVDKSSLSDVPEDKKSDINTTAKVTEDADPSLDTEFDFSAKKKKKSKKKVNMADFEAALNESGTSNTHENTGNLSRSSGALDGDGLGGPASDDEGLGASASETEEEGWLRSDRDYTYSELLGRVFKQLKSNNPELAGEKRKYTIVPPNVLREGNKKTVFANVADISKRMHRSADHVIQFLYAELGTSGSIDGAGRLILKGRFQQKQLETVLRRYIMEYVTCKTCKSPDTLLTKENRLFFLDCESCGSRRSVQGIKQGFQAQTGKRRLTKPQT